MPEFILQVLFRVLLYETKYSALKQRDNEHKYMGTSTFYVNICGTSTFVNINEP